MIAFCPPYRNNCEIITLTLPHLKKQVKNLLEDFPCRTHVYEDPARKNEIMSSIDYGLATSGTVGLELALMRKPHIIGYKMNSLTWMMIKNKLTTNYAHIANILLGKELVPEFIQDKCHYGEMAKALGALMDRDNVTDVQIKGFDEVIELLSPKNDQSSSSMAAETVIKLAS